MADEGFRVVDKRASSRGSSVGSSSGLILNQSVSEAKRLTSKSASAALAAGRQGVVPTDPSESRHMAMARATGRRTGSSAGSSVDFAINRAQDPFFYWEQNNLPYDFTRPEDLKSLRRLCRHIYKAHSVMGSAIDVYSKWPLTGMEFRCKDKALEEFYTDLFFDQLDYEEFLPKVLREYWVVGEAFPMGSFNEQLGVWEAEELLNPDDVFVQESPFVREPSLFIRLPESLRDILTTGQPAEQYQALMRSYPELKAYATESARMPVSNVLLKHLKHDVDSFSPRGLSILYRALRPLMQEEQLNAAQDAIADRLYTPLILARIGASAQDLGTEEPWIPSRAQIEDFNADLNLALAADFRVMTTHFAVRMDSVFGRETMPNFDMDFERLTEKQLQSLGLSKTILSGAGSGQTYAADALNRDVVTQLLSTAQRYIKRFVRQRMLVVAEAQEHFDYELRNGKRYVKMEEILEVDEKGNRKIVEQPKLLVPDFQLASMNMKDETVERDFLGMLRAEGTPISQRRRMVGIDIDLEEEAERVAQEQIDQAVQAQEVRKRTYLKLKAEGLPIPEDLRADFDPKPLPPPESEEQPPAPAADATRPPMLGVDEQDTNGLVPTPEDLATPPGVPLGVPGGPGGTVDPEYVDGTEVADPPNVTRMPRNRMLYDEEGRSRPEESDEMRKHMPKPAALVDRNPQVTHSYTDDSGETIFKEPPGGLISGPRHLGLRRFAKVEYTTRDMPEEEDSSEQAG